jgi:hypothetical protein
MIPAFFIHKSLKTRMLFLNGFSSRLFGRRAEAEARGVREKAQRLDGLAAIVARFIPGGLFDNPVGKRDRVFTPWVTFCAFLGQVLQRGSSCQDVVRRVQAMYLALGDDTVDDATGGYLGLPSESGLGAQRDGFQFFWFSKSTGERLPIEEWRRRRL